MNKTPYASFIGGVLVGLLSLSIVMLFSKDDQGGIGAAPSNGNHIGIYNATPTDMVLRDGYGSALLTDSAGRLVATTTNP